MEFWKQIGSVVNGLAALSTILGGSLISGVYYFVKLEERVAKLEQKINDLPSASPNPTATVVKDSSTTQTAGGLLTQACADLARRSADEISKGAWLTSDQIQKTMSGIGCARTP